MSMQAIGLKAYTNALHNFTKAEKAAQAGTVKAPATAATPFAETLKTSFAKVNAMQQEKNAMVTSFASGEQQNVHELMISLQKAGLAMSMTAAVRNKAMEAYRELSRLQF